MELEGVPPASATPIPLSPHAAGGWGVSIAEMSKVINPHGTCIRARAVGRQRVLGDLVLSSGLTMSPLDGNRTEALTRGFDLRKVCVWEWGLVERGWGEWRGTSNTSLYRATLFPAGAAQKTQPRCVSIRSLGSQHTPSQDLMGITRATSRSIVRN